MRMRLVRIIVLCMAFMTISAAYAWAQDAGFGETLRNFFRGTETDEKETTDARKAAPERRVPFGQAEVQLSFAPLVKATAPAVVNVYASRQAKSAPFMEDPFLEQFFGRARPPRAQSALGSGVLVDPSGIVVTNHHVIRDADEVRVATSDGREFGSRVLLKDESLDLAVLKIDASEPFPSITVGDSDALEVGDLVLAIGNPFGVGQTTTSGIVSALARSRAGISDFGFFVQTDAAINPGNSGGALINMDGQLVGINTAIYSRSGGSIGIGFAIPSNIVRVVTKAAEAGRTTLDRPYIGATFDPVTVQVAEAVGLPRPSGALVAGVVEGAPAAKAGIRPGDVVLAMNQSPIEHVEALGYRLTTQEIGASVAFTLWRAGKERVATVVLERAPEGPAEVAIGGRSPFAGTKVAELSPRLALSMGLAEEAAGVAVVEVEPGSPAAEFGLQRKDIVREVNGETIGTSEELKQIAGAKSRWWRFTVERDGQLLSQMLRF